LAIGTLQKIESNGKSADLASNGVLQFPLRTDFSIGHQMQGEIIKNLQGHFDTLTQRIPGEEIEFWFARDLQELPKLVQAKSLNAVQ
jgi:hypothetical protein